MSNEKEIEDSYEFSHVVPITNPSEEIRPVIAVSYAGEIVVAQVVKKTYDPTTDPLSEGI